jgi:hypothetical protein
MHGRNFLANLLLPLAGLMLAPLCLQAQERAYFITYSQQMEEPGNLEVAINPVLGTQRGGNNFLGSWTELEYGAKAWWTSEFYLDGQHTFDDSTVFTGWRWENRFRPLMRDHWIDPVLYFEFEDINAADKTLLEIVGFDGQADHAVRNAVARRDRQREMETKLILSSNFKGWNLSENFIAEKNLAGGPFEFGYAAGLSRPLALAASSKPCNFCRENLTAGFEMYGGLGTANRLTVSGTSHYIAPLIAWEIPGGPTFRLSPGWGLTDTSHRFLLRWGISYELTGFERRVRRLFR